MGLFGPSRITGKDIGTTQANSFLEHYENRLVSFYESYNYSEKPTKEAVFSFLVAIECFSVLLATNSTKIVSVIDSEILQDIRTTTLSDIINKQTIIKIDDNRQDDVFNFFVDLLGTMATLKNQFHNKLSPGIEYIRITEELEKQCGLETGLTAINGLIVNTLVTSKAIATIDMYLELKNDFKIEK